MQQFLLEGGEVEVEDLSSKALEGEVVAQLQTALAEVGVVEEEEEEVHHLMVVVVAAAAE